MQRPYVIGIDFGTMSARAVLVDSRNGSELSSAIHEYRHGVIDKTLPGEKAALKPRTALQHPADYLEALEKTIPALLRKGRVSARRVGGIGTDFTACTVLPVRS